MPRLRQKGSSGDRIQAQQLVPGYRAGGGGRQVRESLDPHHLDNESKSDAAKKTQQVTPTSLADAHQFALAKARTQYDVQAQQSTPLKQRAVERLKEEEAFLRFQDKLRDVAPDRLDDAFTELGQCAHALCARPNATATLAWLGNEFAETILSKIHTVDRKQTTGREEALASEQFAQRAMALLAAGKLTSKGFEALLAGFAAGMRGVGGMGPDPADSTNQNEGIPQRVLFASAGHAASARDGLRNVVQGNAGNGALADTGRAMDRALRLSEHATTLAGLIDSLGKDDRNIGQDEDQSRQSHGQTQAPSSRAIHGSPAGKPASQEAAPRSQARSFPDHPRVQDDHDARIRDLEQELGKARKQLDQAKAGRRDGEELKSASLLAQNATIRVPADNQSQVDRLNQEVNQLRKELDALKESQATPHPEQRPSASQKDSTELESKARPQDLNPSPSSIDRERSRVLAAQMAELRKRVVLLSKQQSNGGARHEAAPSVDHTEDIQALSSRLALVEELLRERSDRRSSVDTAQAASHDAAQDRPSPILRNRASSPLRESPSVKESKKSPTGNPDSTPSSSPSNSNRSSTPPDSLTPGLHQEGTKTSNVVSQINAYLAGNDKSGTRIEVNAPAPDLLNEPKALQPSSTTEMLQPASLPETRAESPAPLTDTKSQRPEGPQMKTPLDEGTHNKTDASLPQPAAEHQHPSAPLVADLSRLQADFNAQELANAQKLHAQDTSEADPLPSHTEGISPSEPALGNSDSSMDPTPASARLPASTKETGAADDRIQQEASGKPEEPIASNAGPDSVAGGQAPSPIAKKGTEEEIAALEAQIAQAQADLEVDTAEVAQALLADAQVQAMARLEQLLQAEVEAREQALAELTASGSSDPAAADVRTDPEVDPKELAIAEIEQAMLDETRELQILASEIALEEEEGQIAAMQAQVDEETHTRTDANLTQPEAEHQSQAAPLEADLSWLQADFDAQDRALQVASAQELANAQKQHAQDTSEADPLPSHTEGISPSEPALGNSDSSTDPTPASARLPASTKETGAADDRIQQEASGKPEEPIASNAGPDSVAGRQAPSPIAKKGTEEEIAALEAQIAQAQADLEVDTAEVAQALLTDAQVQAMARLEQLLQAEVEAREQALAELTASGSSDPAAADARRQIAELQAEAETHAGPLTPSEEGEAISGEQQNGIGEKRTPRPEPLPTGQAPFEPPHRSTETEANPPSRSSSFDIETDDEQEPSTDSVEGTESPLSTDSDELPATPDDPAIGLGGGLASRLYAEEIPRSEFESRLKLSLRLLSSINFANEEVRSTEFMEFADAIKDDDLETLVEAMADVALEMIFEAAEDEEAPPLVRPRTTSTTAEEAAASGDQPPLPDGFTWLNRGQAKDAAGNLAARANSYTREVPLSASQEVQGLKARIAWRHGRQSAIKEIGAQFRASTPTPDPASPTPAMPQEVVSSQPEAIPLTSATGSASPTTLTLEPLSSGDGDRDRQTVPDGSGSRHTAAQNDTPLTRGPEGSSPVEPQLNGPISPGNRSSGPVLTVTGGRDAAPITDGSDKTQPLEQGDPPPPQFPDRLQSLLEAAPDLMREVFFSSSLKIAQNLAGVGNVKLKPLEKTISRFLDDQVAFDRDFEASLVDLIPGGAQAKPIQIEYMAKVAAIRSDVIHQAFSKAAESPEFRDRLKIRLATLEKTTRVSGIFDFCHAMRMKLESTHPGPSTGIQQGTPHTTASQATGVQASAPSSFLEEDDDAQATRATEESEALMTSLNERTAQEKARVIWQYLGDKLIPTSGKDRDEDWLPPDREVQEALLQPIAKGLDDEAAESLILHLAHEVTRSARAQRSWEIADHALTLIAQRIVATNSEKNPIEKQRKALADAMASRPDARNARSKKIAGNIMTRLGARLLLAGAPQPRAESSSSSIDPKEFLADVAALERDTADKLAKIAENSALEKAREGDQRKTKPPGSTAESKASGGTSAIPGFVRRINEISEELSSALKTLPSDSRQWPSHMAGIFHDLSVSRSSPGGTTNTAAGELLGRTLGLGPTSPQVDETRLQDELQGVLAGSIQFASKVEDLSEFVQGLLDVAGGKHARAIARAAASATKAPLTGRPKLNAEGLVDFLIRQNNPAIIAEMRLHAAGNSLIAGALGLLDTESSDRAGRSSSTPTLRTSTRITDAARKDPASLLDAPVEEFVQDPWPERMSLVQAAMTERLAQRERDRGTWKDIGDKLAGKLNLGDLIPDHKEATWIKNHTLGLEQAMNAILGQVSDDDAMAALLEGLTEDVTPNAMPTLARATLNAAEKIHGQREQRARQAVGTVFQKLYTTLSANKDMKGLPSVRTEARTLIERIQALVDSPPATDITRQARLSFSAEHSSRPKDTKG